ncbi:MAG: MoxR family ATPase [Verrucomicrobiota bacterium]
MTDSISSRFEAVRDEIKKVILGQEALIEQALIGLLAGGHVIVEGVPGLAKTLFAKALAASLDLKYQRIQFTPDLMPSDLIGTNVFQPDTQSFRFIQGPVFADIVLADEINRTPAKTQSALLEAMEERQVSADGNTYPLPPGFFVIATQNPVEYEGTFPLPEAQIDRFLLKIRLTYPTPADELRLLQTSEGPAPSIAEIRPAATSADLMEVREAIRKITFDGALYDYVLRLVAASRNNPQIALGASPRAGLGWVHAARVLAALRGRDYATPDDVKELAAPVLRHRLVLAPEAAIEGLQADAVIEQLLSSVEVPR